MMDRVDKMELFMDSGAFSAWSQKIDISIDDYIAFILKYEKHFSVYANLDVIGDADATLVNQRKMEDAGLNPLPCYHYGEPWQYLEMYLEDYDYIALGGLGPLRGQNSEIAKYFDQCFFKYICKPDGIPKVRVHAFGMTSLRLMLRYPWYSVDSTTWIMTGRMGQIYVPRLRGGKFDYLKEAWKVQVSTRSNTKKDEGSTHIDTFSPLARDLILSYFKDKGYVIGSSYFKEVDIDFEKDEGDIWAQSKKTCVDGKRLLEVVEERGLSNDYRLRDTLNAEYFIDLESAMPEWPWAFQLKVPNKGFDI